MQIVKIQLAKYRNENANLPIFSRFYWNFDPKSPEISYTPSGNTASAVYAMPASWEVVCCWAPHPVLSITSGFSNTITRQRCLITTTVGRRSCHTHENCMHAEQIIIIFHIYFFIFCSLYLLLFLIVLYRTIVTVYTHNIFLYTYGKCIK